MNVLVRIMLCCFAIQVAGCAHYKSYVKSSHEQYMCKVTCKQGLVTCMNVCHDNCPQCCLSAKQRTARDYNHYVEQKIIQGEPIVRRLNSYRDPLQCRKTSCDCPTDYRVCIQTCTGTIPKRLQVAPTC